MSSTDSVTTSVEVAVDPATAFEVFTEEIDAWYQRGPHSWKNPDRAVAVRFEPGDTLHITRGEGTQHRPR